MSNDKFIITEKPNATVYNATTTPKKPKKKRRDKSDLGPDFVAPDGGWGWVVCLAAGFSNFSIFPALQQYGFIYRERLAELHFDARQITTIVNIIMAVSSLVGIVNGAIFRRFTFRQVALVGASLVFSGIILSAFCSSFIEYVICFSCIYGIGLGLSMAATSLAVNTYFKNKRRRATGFSWTITGLGPIIFPHISVFLLSCYGAQGTILIYGGITLNAILCALTLQPVLWHVKKPEKELPVDEAKGDLVPKLNIDPEYYECKYCQMQRFETTTPDTPMLPRSNDGWFGSNISIASIKGERVQKRLGRRDDVECNNDDQHNENSKLQQANQNNQRAQTLQRLASKTSVYSRILENELYCTCAEQKARLQTLSNEQLKLEQEKLKAEMEAEELAKEKMSFKQKLVKFFDLDLLKDFTFVNLALGLTIMMYGEMNFSVLTPFILNSYGYSDAQISLVMSLLGGMDITVRFLAPFVLEKVKLDNRVLFSFGIIAISIGRLIVTMTNSYHVVVGVFILIGFGKGFRTIFSPLIIPSYVPLKRLPAASGLQLISNFLFSVVFGPILGFIADYTSYTITIHFINSLTCFALSMWIVEAIVRRIIKKRAERATDG